MHLAAKMTALAGLTASWAVWLGGPWLVVLGWLALDFALAAVAWHRQDTRLFGKRADGTRSPGAALLMLPYGIFAGAVWHAARWLSREPATGAVQSGLTIGRRHTGREVPPAAERIIDLTCEFTEPRVLRQHPGYRCLPILDGGTPQPSALDALLGELDPQESIFVHCAQGHGRSAMVAAALLVARGAAPDVASALARVQAARPAAVVNAAQRRFLDRWQARRMVCMPLV